MSRLFAVIDRRPRLVLAIILLLALTIRVSWTITRPVDAAAIERLPDQREYLDLGRSLLRDGTLAMGDARFNDVVRAFRMPGYPAIVAACGGNVRALLVVQAMIDASTVLATIWLARCWLSRPLSLFAGLLIVFDPLHVYFTALVLSETVVVALLTWGMACLVHGFSPLSASSWRGRVLWSLGVVLLIAAIYVRPSALLFPIVLAFVATLAEARSRDLVSSGNRVPVLATVALGTALALLPWALRNQSVLGKPIFTTTNDGFTLYDGLNPDADGSSNQSWVSTLPLLPNLSEVQRSDYLRDKAIGFARERPRRVIAMIPGKLARTWSPWPLSAEYGSRRNVILAAAHAVPLFLLAILGLRNARLPRTARLFLLAPAILITIMHGLTVGSLRYRVPADTSLAVLAAAAFHERRRSPDDAAR